MEEDIAMTDEVTGAAIKPEPTYLPRLAKGATINMFGAISRTLLLYCYTLLLARTLSPGDLGTYFLIFTLVSIFSLVATVGMDFGMVRYVALYAGEKRYAMVRKTLSAGLALGALTSVFVAVCLIVLAPQLKNILLDESPVAISGLRIFALSIPFWVAARLFNATTQGIHQMQYQVFSRDLGEQASKLALSAVALTMGMGLLGVIGANLASVIIAAFLSMLFTYTVLPKSHGEKVSLAEPAKKMYRYSLPLAFSNIIGMVLIWTDTLLMGYLGTSADVGFYGAALRVGSTFSSTILMAFITVFQPVISDLYNRHQLEELRDLFKTVSRWMFMCSYPVFLVLVLFADPIMRIFGGQFAVGSIALMILALGQLVNATTGSAGIIVVMSGRSQMELLNVGVALIVNTAVCFWLIPRYGVVGAAIANMSAVTVLNLLRVAEVWIFMRMHAYSLSYLKPFSAGTAGALLVFLVSRYVLDGSGLFITAVLAAAVLIIYLLAIWAMGLDDHDRTVLNMVKKRLPRLV